MVARKELKVMEVYELFGEKRYRICIEGTNIVLNIGASSEEEALNKALEIMKLVNLDAESLEKVRSILKDKSKC